jgi:hypothetical protein
MSDNTLPRRGLLRSLVSLPALAVVPVASAASASTAHPDAELFALRDQLSALMDRKRPITEQVRLCHQKMRELYCQYGRTDEALHRSARLRRRRG